MSVAYDSESPCTTCFGLPSEPKRWLCHFPISYNFLLDPLVLLNVVEMMALRTVLTLVLRGSAQAVVT
jgi:hypothetical protein